MGLRGSRLSAEDLDDVLEDLYSAGSFDSSGQFSLRADKALEKLSAFQLKERFHYILNLFAAGLMAGATSFEVRFTTFSTALHFPGATIPCRRLEEVFSYLLHSPSSDQEWSLHEMAIGIKASGRAGVEAVRVEDTTGTVEFRGDRSVLDSTAQSTIGLTITLSHGPWYEALWRWLWRSRLPEFKALRGIARFSPIPWRLRSGRRRVDVPAGGTCFETIEVKDPLMSTRLDDGWLALGVEGQLGRRNSSQLTIVIRGRPFHRLLKLGKAQIRGLLRADHLRLDLSQSGPVEDTAFLELIRRVTKEVDAMRYRWLTEEHPDPHLPVYRPIARQVARSFRTQGKLNESLAIVEKVPHSDVQRYSLHFQKRQYRQAHDILMIDMGTSEMASHRLAYRLLDLAAIQACLDEKAAEESWRQGYELLASRNEGRRDHVLGAALESKLYWLANLEPQNPRLPKLWNEANSKKKHLGKSHLRRAPSFELGALLGLLQPSSGELKPPLSLAQEAYDIRRQHQGEGDPDIGQSLTLLALASHALGLEDASKYAHQRLSLMRVVYGAHHPEVAASHSLLAALGVEPDKHRRVAYQILSTLGLASSLWDPRVVCYRGWFHSRCSWGCLIPLCWPGGLVPPAAKAPA